jgi:hypothetical protein
MTAGSSPTLLATEFLTTLLFGDKLIGQLIPIISLAGKILREDFAAALNGFTETVAGRSGLQARRHDLNDLIPSAWRNFFVDTPVGQDFDAVFQQ